MKDTYQFTLPWAPTVNTYWTIARNRFVLSNKGRAYKAEVGELLDSLGLAGIQLVGPLEVRLELYPPDKRRRDVDNYSKGILDALTNAGFWEDDSQVEVLVQRKRERVVKGKVEVTVNQL